MPSKPPLERKLEQRCVKYAEAFGYDSVKLDMRVDPTPTAPFSVLARDYSLSNSSAKAKNPDPSNLAQSGDLLSLDLLFISLMILTTLLNSFIHQ